MLRFLTATAMAAALLAATPVLADRDRDRGPKFSVRSGHCPPGLAKKGNGCRPPGLAKRDRRHDRDDRWREGRHDRWDARPRHDDDRWRDDHDRDDRWRHSRDWEDDWRDDDWRRRHAGDRRLIIGPRDVLYMVDPYRYGLDPRWIYLQRGNEIWRADPETRQILAFVGLVEALLR